MTNTAINKTVTIDFTLQQFVGALLAALSEAGVISTSAVAGTTGVSGTAGASGTFTTTKHAADTEIVEKYTQAGADWLSRDRGFYDARMSSMHEHDVALREAAIRAVDSAVGTYGLADIQSRAHRDLAHDRKWNINETDFIASQSLRDLNSGGVVTTGMLAAMASSIAADVVKGMSASE